MKPVVWSDTARDELRQAIRHIANEDQSVARLVRERIARTVALLGERPIGRRGRVEGTYEKTVLKTSHIIAYAVSEAEITILHLIHHRRDWPAGKWP